MSGTGIDRQAVMGWLEAGMTQLGKAVHQGQRGIWISQQGPQVGHIRSLDTGNTVDFLPDGEMTGYIISPKEFIPGWYIRLEDAVRVAGNIRGGTGTLTTQKEMVAYLAMIRRGFVNEIAPAELVRGKKTHTRVQATLTPLWLYIESFHGI